MYLDDDLAEVEAEPGGFGFVEDCFNDIDFNEVIAGADGSQLIPAALLGLAGYRERIGALDSAARLDALQVAGLAESCLDGARRSVAQNRIEVGALHSMFSTFADA